MNTRDQRLDVSELGITFVISPSGADLPEGDLVFDVIGHPRGFITHPLTSRHVHVSQSERYEVISGEMEVELDGRMHRLRAGNTMTVPAGSPHRQLPAGSGPGHVRVTVSPAGRTEEYLRHLAALSRDRQFSPAGFPRPLASARMLRDFSDTGYGTSVPLRVQRAAAAAMLAGAPAARPLHSLLRAGATRLWREYAFVDEWDVAAAPRAVYDALADGRTYPCWWRPVYIAVAADGPPAVGSVSHQHFKGRLPYHLHTRSKLVRLEPGRLIDAEVDGDLRGRGVWTLSATASGTHVRFDWTVHADRPLLRVLTPVLRPALRANHNWAIARAIEGLEPYVVEQAHGPREAASEHASAGVS